MATSLEPPPVQAPAGRSRGLIAALAIALVVIIALAITAVLALNHDEPAKPARPPASPSPSPSAPTVSDIFGAVGPSVVVIRTKAGALGTGVIVAEDGAILTANHVVDDGTAVSLIYADGTRSGATIASADAKRDVATLRPAGLPGTLVPATIGGGAEQGAPVVAIGNPLGLTFSVSSGVVSGLDRSAKTDSGEVDGLIQFDASVNPGSSGGPLLDGNGAVIGIVVAIADPGGDDAFAGIGFAVPIGAALGGGDGDGPGAGGPQI